MSQARPQQLRGCGPGLCRTGSLTSGWASAPALLQRTAMQGLDTCPSRSGIPRSRRVTRPRERASSSLSPGLTYVPCNSGSKGGCWAPYTCWMLLERKKEKRLASLWCPRAHRHLRKRTVPSNPHVSLRAATPHQLPQVPGARLEGMVPHTPTRASNGHSVRLQTGWAGGPQPTSSTGPRAPPAQGCWAPGATGSPAASALCPGPQQDRALMTKHLPGNSHSVPLCQKAKRRITKRR